MRSKKIIIIVIFMLMLTGCKEKTFTVTFDTLGGSLLDSITLTKGDNIQNIKAPTKEGYLFVSWLKDGIEYNLENPISEDIKLTANWIKAPEIFNYYTVTFVTEEKTDKFTVKENDLIDELKAPEKENYLFLGWYVGEEKFDFNTPITKNIALVAKYELNVVTIKYDLDGGFGLAMETIPKNTTLSIVEQPSKIGYRFLKWTLNNKEFSFDTKITEDITLKAVWELIEYVTINFDTDGGDVISSKTIEKHGKLTELPIATKQDYNFVEWQLDNQTFNLETEIENDITLIAIFEPKLPTTNTDVPESSDPEIEE